MLKTNEIGRSMIEMIGVIAIIGVLSTGGLAGYTKAMNAHKDNQLIDQISMIISSARNFKNRAGTFAGLNAASAIKLKIIPSNMDKGTTQEPSLFHAQGGSMSVYTGSDYVGFSFQNLSQGTCIKLAKSNWGDITTAFGVGLDDDTGPVASGSSAAENKYVSRNKNATIAEAANACQCKNSNDCIAQFIVSAK